MGKLTFFALLALLLSPHMTRAGILFQNQLRPFTTDGCSLFPDGIPFKDKDLWLQCCQVHDLAYWKGGTKEDKKTADEGLKTCVASKGHPAIGEVMYWGVRMGGVPSLPTSWRWGYGWIVARGYKPLNADQLKLVETGLGQIPLTLDAIPVQKTVMVPQQDTITGDYCLDLIGQKIEDRMGHSFVIEDIQQSLNKRADQSFSKVYVIQVEGCSQKFHGTLELKKKSSCTPPQSLVATQADIRLTELKGPHACLPPQ